MGVVYITFKKGMRVDLVQQGVAFELRLTKDEDKIQLSKGIGRII